MYKITFSFVWDFSPSLWCGASAVSLEHQKILTQTALVAMVERAECLKCVEVFMRIKDEQCLEKFAVRKMYSFQPTSSEI